MEYMEVPCNICGSRDYGIFAEGPDFEYRCSRDEFRVVKCKDCGLLYLNPRPAPCEISTIYPESYIPYHFDKHLSTFVYGLRTLIQKSKVSAIKKVAPFNAIIYDVGCGGGFFLECLRRFGGENWTLIGIDVSKTAIEKIESKGFKGICSRFEEMKAVEGSTDVIVLNQVIEHLDNPSAVIDKSYYILKREGYLFIETPNVNGWDARIFKSRHWGGWHFPRHWTFFDQNTMSKLLEKKGFHIVNTTWLLSPNFWIQSVHHWCVERGYSGVFADFMDCKNPFLLAFFSSIDLVQRFFGSTSNMRIIGQKR